MITIYAEKPDVGNKIAAALDCITLSSGKKVTFKDLKSNEKAVKSQQFKDGYLKINFKGEECYVTWGYGHLCELKQAQDYDSDYKNWSKMPMPFIPKSYDVKVKSEVKKQFNLVKDLMNKSRLVINATDFDREGELIFYYLYQASKCKTPFKRAHFNSQTEEALKESFDHLKSEKDVENMTNAGIGRSIADAVVGWNMTTKLTLKVNTRNVLSVGRVQTPTLNFLVEREKEIRSFKPEPYYTISALFKTTKKEEYKGEHEKKKFDDKDEAEKIMKAITGKSGTVKDVKKKTVEKDPPLLYSLSTLQATANKKYGFSLSKTLKIAQELYEAGFTTYPRTDSQYLTEDMEPVVWEVLHMLEKNPTYEKFITGKTKLQKKNRYFNDKKVSSHFAIIPTKSKASGLTINQEKIYDLVAKSVIMMLYGSAQLEEKTVITEVEKNNFVSTGVTVLVPEWLLIDPMAKESILPDLKVGDKVSGTYKMESKMTQPPKRYTDATLLSAMKSAGKELADEELRNVMLYNVKGIGTEATRAAIVDSLIARGYAERDKKSIYATDKGISVIDALPIEEMKSAELTAEWENRLDKIAKGEESLAVFVNDIENVTRKWVKELDVVDKGKVITTNTYGTCPSCGGNIIKTKFGYGCSNWKSGCKFTISSVIAGHKMTEANVRQLISKGETGNLKFKSKAGKDFICKLKLNDEHKIEFLFNDPKKK